MSSSGPGLEGPQANKEHEVFHFCKLNVSSYRFSQAKFRNFILKIFIFCFYFTLLFSG